MPGTDGTAARKDGLNLAYGSRLPGETRLRQAINTNNAWRRLALPLAIPNDETIQKIDYPHRPAAWLGIPTTDSPARMKMGAMLNTNHQFFQFPFRHAMQYVLVSTTKSFRLAGASMAKAQTTKGRKWRHPTLHRVELDKLLDILSACDRGVVEFSMGLYKVPHRERVAVRSQNRRLHRALKASLPRLLQPPQPLFELSDSR
jgi:hypothetical protein